jgi:hypothetical protein
VPPWLGPNALLEEKKRATGAKIKEIFKLSGSRSDIVPEPLPHMSKGINGRRAATAASTAEPFSAGAARRGSYEPSNPMTALTKIRKLDVLARNGDRRQHHHRRGTIPPLQRTGHNWRPDNRPDAADPPGRIGMAVLDLANGMLGTQRAALTPVVLLAATAAFSWHTGRSFACSLIMVGFGAFTSLTAAPFAAAGYVLIFGGRAPVIWQHLM